MPKSYKIKELKSALVESLEELVRRDLPLLKQNAHERAISHRVALYLEKRFPVWSVDCEYHRKGQDGDPKRLDALHQVVLARLRGGHELQMDRADTVFPAACFPIQTQNFRRSRLVALAQAIKVADVLIAHGADPLVRDAEGKSFLDILADPRWADRVGPLRAAVLRSPPTDSVIPPP